MKIKGYFETYSEAQNSKCRKASMNKDDDGG